MQLQCGQIKETSGQLLRQLCTLKRRVFPEYCTCCKKFVFPFDKYFVQHNKHFFLSAPSRKIIDLYRVQIKFKDSGFRVHCRDCFARFCFSAQVGLFVSCDIASNVASKGKIHNARPRKQIRVQNFDLKLQKISEKTQ